jgi:hypothetical protein
LDLFNDRSTAGIFYTTDMRVLIDIVVRQLTDLCPGMAVSPTMCTLWGRREGPADEIPYGGKFPWGFIFVVFVFQIK